jgi:hypothetical protein
MAHSGDNSKHKQNSHIMNNDSESSSTPSQDNIPATPPADATPSTTPPPAPANIGSKNPVKLLIVLLVVLVVAGASSGATYMLAASGRHKSEKALKKEIAALNSTDYKLPAGSTQLGDCVPSMGVHHMLKDSDPEYGPFIVTNKQGKVIGIEYMAAADMYTNIPNTDPPVQLVEKNSPVYGWKIDHIEVSHLPKGHPGLERDHIDVHLYTVDMEEEMNACK